MEYKTNEYFDCQCPVCEEYVVNEFGFCENCGCDWETKIKELSDDFQE